MVKLESIVIVKNKYGSVATVRFSEPMQDRIISSNNKKVLYTLVEKHVKRVLKDNE